MEPLKVFVDMEVFGSGNDPRLNLVSVLYKHYRGIPNNLNTDGAFLIRKDTEQVFSRAVTALQCINSDEPRFGYPGRAENPYEILHRNSLAFEVESIISDLLRCMLKVSGHHSAQVVFKGSMDDRQQKIANWLVGIANGITI